MQLLQPPTTTALQSSKTTHNHFISPKTAYKYSQLILVTVIYPGLILQIRSVSNFLNVLVRKTIDIPILIFKNELSEVSALNKIAKKKRAGD